MKIGGDWKTEIVNPFIPDQKISVKSTLVSKQKLLGIDTLKVKMEMTVPLIKDGLDKDIVHVTNFYYIDPKEGHLIRFIHSLPRLLMNSPIGEIKADLNEQRTLIVTGLNEKEDTPEKDEKAEAKL